MSKALVSAVLAMTLFATPASAEAVWVSWTAGDCMCDGFRNYVAILMNVPAGQSSMDACYRTPATVNGHSFSGANRCVYSYSFQFGYFYVGDASCSSTGTDPMNWTCYQDPASTDPSCQICHRKISCDIGQTYHTC